MRLVEDDDVPGHRAQIRDLGLGELIGADDGRANVEWVGDAVTPLLVVALGLQDLPVQRELVLELLMPLLAQVGGDDDQHATLALGPELRQHEAGLDGLAQPHLIGEDHTAR